MKYGRLSAYIHNIDSQTHDYGRRSVFESVTYILLKELAGRGDVSGQDRGN